MSSPSYSSFTSPPTPVIISDPSTLSTILKSSPSGTTAASASALSCNTLKTDWEPALQLLAATLISLTASLYLLSFNNYFLYPFALLLAAFSLSLLYLVAHDSVHQLFFPSSIVNTIAMHLLLLPFYQTPASFTPRSTATITTEVASDLASLTNEERNKLLHKYADDGSYDDSVPITSTLKQWAIHHSSYTSSILTYSVLAAITLYLLYTAPLVYIRYWLLPLVFYPLIYPTVFYVFSNNIETVLSHKLSETIPCYHLGTVSSLISDYTAGRAKKAQTVTNSPIDSNGHKKGSMLTEWKIWFLDTWPRLHWVNIYFVCVIPIIGFISARYVALTTPTMVWALIYYVVSGLGITAGYHRLFAHRAYEARPSIIVLMMLMGTAALQGSVKWWCGGHRIHHRYTDTDFDPYSAKTGFWYAHIGWMLVHPKPEYKIKADLKDLNDQAIIRWQHRNYLWLGPFMAFVFPTLIAGIGWNDWWGGLVYAGMLRLFAVHHATFCVNSVAHWFGEHTFDDNRTPRDHIVTAFLTFGEGYHNFHHEFPNDYRNGIRTYDYDPTKWLIKALNLLGLTYQLRVFPANEIQKGKIHMREKTTAAMKQHVIYPPSVETLPEMTWTEIREQCRNGKQLTVIDDLVHDISVFIPRHPGGKAFIESSIGCDATVRFRGETGVYKHSQAAHHLLSGYRVARLAEGVQEKQERKEKEAERLKRFHQPSKTQ